MTIDDIPAFSQISHPVIEIKDRMIRVTLEDKGGNLVELKFQPYQALRITTQDCYSNDNGSAKIHDELIYQRSSAWLEELKAALRMNDDLASFMNKSIHFVVPAEDDVLEVAAWKVEVTQLGKTIVFPG